MDFERVPNSAGLNSVKSVLVLLKYAYLKGKKKKEMLNTRACFLKRAMSRAHALCIIFVNINIF